MTKRPLHWLIAAVDEHLPNAHTLGWSDYRVMVLDSRDTSVTRARGFRASNKDTPVYTGHYVHEESQEVHTHSFIEIVVVAGGTGFHVTAAESHELAVGDVLVLRPGVWHGYENCRSLDIYSCCFSTELLRDELAWMQEDPLLGYLLCSGPYAMQRRGLLTARLRPDALQACIEHLEALERLRAGPGRRYLGDVIGRLTLLLATLGRAAANERTNDVALLQDDPLAVAQVLQMMEASVAYPWTLKEIADPLHLAPRYLTQLFKATTGVLPMTYLSRFRAEMAATMLIDTDLSVEQICRRVGWPDHGGFARRFKSHFGMAASTYRLMFSGTAFD